MRKQRFLRTGTARLAMLVLGTEVMIASTPATAAASGDETARDEARVIAADHYWLDAEVGGDTAWLDAMLLPE